MKKKIFSFLSVFALAAIFLASCTKSYTVDFEEDGGSEVAAIEVVEGEAFAAPEAPTKEGYVFGGWYKDANCTEAYNFNLPVNEDFYLYAKWNVRLTFNSNGGKAVESMDLEPSKPFTLPKTEKEGYIFGGWYVDENFTIEQTILAPAKNTTVYAQWLEFDENTKLNMNSWTDNDGGAYEITEADGVSTIKATQGKGEWSYVYYPINFDATSYSTVVIDLKGTKDVEVIFKFEGGGAAAVEHKVVMTGEDQTIYWTVNKENLTETGGERFLIFLNGGKAGCSETPEYLEIKNCSLYMAKEHDELGKESVIFFETNGANAINPIIGKIGVTATAPKNPTKDGYVFCGWYQDEAFNGDTYEFTTIPEKPITLYAKWEKLMDIVKDDFNGMDANTYTFDYKDGKLLVKKTGTGEWQFFKSSLTGAEIPNAKSVTIVLKGVPGQKIAFKPFDQKETAVECDGKLQTITIDLSDITYAEGASAIVGFINGGVAAASEEFEIHHIYFDSSYNVLDEFTSTADGKVTAAYADNKLSIQKTEGAGAWASITALLGEDIKCYSGLNITLKGVAGEKIIIKVNNNGKFEKNITCTGEYQSFYIDLTGIEINEEEVGIYMFPHFDADSSGVFEFTNLEFVGYDYVPDEVINKSSDLTDSEIVALDEGTYEIAGGKGEAIVLKKTSTASYSFVKTTAMGDVIEGYSYLNVVVEGVKDQKISFKVNDIQEFHHTCTGGVDYVTFDISSIAVDASKTALLMFVNGGVEAASEEFTIYNLQLATYPGRVDLINDEIVPLDPDTYEISKSETGSILLKKTSTASYSFVKTTAMGDVIEGAKYLVARVKSVKDQVISFKVNDVKEFHHTCTGEIDLVCFDLEGMTMNPEKTALLMFVNGGVEAASEQFEIVDLYYSYVNLPYLINTENITPLDEGSYNLKVQDGIFFMQKTSTAEYSFIKTAETGADILGYTSFNVTLQGVAGQKITFKLNDQVEFAHECTGELENVSYSFADLQLVPEKPALLMFVNGGVAAASEIFAILTIQFTN